MNFDLQSERLLISFYYLLFIFTHSCKKKESFVESKMGAVVLGDGE